MAAHRFAHSLAALQLDFTERSGAQAIFRYQRNVQCSAETERSGLFHITTAALSQRREVVSCALQMERSRQVNYLLLF